MQTDQRLLEVQYRSHSTEKIEDKVYKEGTVLLEKIRRKKDVLKMLKNRCGKNSE